MRGATADLGHIDFYSDLLPLLRQRYGPDAQQDAGSKPAGAVPLHELTAKICPDVPAQRGDLDSGSL